MTFSILYSHLGFSQYWGDHPQLFASISQGKTPEERLLNTTRWFISTLYGSYSSRSTTAGMEKKPYNPVLGEQYFAQWTGDTETGDTVLKSEQVSHHPPVSVYIIAFIFITPRTELALIGSDLICRHGVIALCLTV